MTENEIGTLVIDAAIALHRELGPGLLESVYETLLARELTERGLEVARQVPVLIVYKGVRFDEGFRADIMRCVNGLAEYVKRDCSRGGAEAQSLG